MTLNRCLNEFGSFRARASLNALEREQTRCLTVKTGFRPYTNKDYRWLLSFFTLFNSAKWCNGVASICFGSATCARAATCRAAHYINLYYIIVRDLYKNNIFNIRIVY